MSGLSFAFFPDKKLLLLNGFELNQYAVVTILGVIIYLFYFLTCFSSSCSSPLEKSVSSLAELMSTVPLVSVWVWSTGHVYTAILHFSALMTVLWTLRLNTMP